MIHKITKHLTFIKENNPNSDAIVVTSNDHQDVIGQIRYTHRGDGYCFLMEGNNVELTRTYKKEIFEVIDELNKDAKWKRP